MCLSGRPSAVTNIPVVHFTFMAIQSNFDLEPKEPQKRHEKIGRVTAIILIQKSPSGSSVRAYLPYAK